MFVEYVGNLAGLDEEVVDMFLEVFITHVDKNPDFGLISDKLSTEDYSLLDFDLRFVHHVNLLIENKVINLVLLQDLVILPDYLDLELDFFDHLARTVELFDQKNYRDISSLIFLVHFIKRLEDFLLDRLIDLQIIETENFQVFLEVCLD